MPSAPCPAPVLKHPSVGQVSSGRATVPQQSAPPLASDQLLQGAKAVGILHNGALYRLQATKLGKLILTK